MSWIKSWLKPTLMIVVWITVLSYTVSMLATVEPSLRNAGKTGLTNASVDAQL